ncbi:MAG: hypothetical protein A2020_03245 [Lentisphaerae bacterium GWF2_45_14]|nr:MAG: hypothetical protein A2020_03245 [Lentisphaerae bacterium GWF2_45_14]
MKPFAMLVAAVCFVLCAEARDIKTLDGKVYKDVTICDSTAYGIDISYTPEGGGIGIKELFFKNLPEDIRKEFNYEPKKAESLQKKVAMYRWKLEQQQIEAYKKELKYEQDEEAQEEHITAVICAHKKYYKLLTISTDGNGAVAWADSFYSNVTEGHEGKVYVFGLQDSPQGSAWEGYLYPVGFEVNGQPAYATNTDDAYGMIMNKKSGN